MHKKLITLCALQLLASPVFASEESIAKKLSATQQIEKLKEHIPVPELQKIVMEYIGNEYMPITLDQKKRIVRAALSKNGVYLISFSTMSKGYYHSEETVKIWKFENDAYKLTHEFAIPMMVYNVAISNDGKYIALEPNSTSVHIWELKNNRYSEIQAEKNLFQNSKTLQFFGHDKMLGRATNDSINIWQLSDKTNTFVHQRDFPIYQELIWAAFSSDGRYIAASMHDGSIHFWKPLQRDIMPVKSLETISELPVRVTISPDSDMLAAYRAGTHLFKMTNENPSPIEIIEKDEEIFNLKFSHDNRYIALDTLDGSRSYKSKINVWKLNPKSLQYEMNSAILGDQMDLIGFAPDNSIVTVNVNPVNNNHELAVWENQKEKLEQDTGEKIKSASGQVQTVVTEVD